MDEQQWQLDQWYLSNQSETQKKKQKKRKQTLNPKIPTENSPPKFEVAAVVKMEYSSDNENGDGHEESIEGKICKCDSCGMVFSNLVDLKEHVLGVHKPHKPYKCDLCSESYCYKSQLIKHKKEVHQIVIEIKCDLCGKIFNQEKNLKQHTYIVHEGNKDYKCDQVSVRLQKKGNHKKVESFLQSSILKVFFILQCGKEFGHSTHLNLHINVIHKGLRDFKCDQVSVRLQAKGNHKKV